MKYWPGAAITMALLVCARPCAAQVDPSERTADMPDSWLVLYNANDPTSTMWKDWYIAQWGIPEENTLGLDVSTAERVHRDHFDSQIFYPVQAHLNDNPELEAKIMGILVGFRVPGNFYLDSTHPPYQSGGGWSVSSNLQDMAFSTWYKRSNPHYFVAYATPDEQRLTKADLGADCYLSARLDGPSVADVGNMTTRARAITTATGPLPASDRLYYDYEDVGQPAGDNWEALQRTLACAWLTQPAWQFPWLAFDSDNEPAPNCAMHFTYYQLTGWQNVPWDADPLGSRIVAHALNSYGATTVRSTTDHNGRFVPNALVNGHFAAAIGATAEPYLGSEPHPDTIVWCLSRGWTLGEAFFCSNPFRNHMWELVGDPLLRVPQWFVNPPPDAPSDLGPPELVAGGETADGSPTLLFTQADAVADDLLSYQIQIDDDADFASPIVDYTSGPLPQGPASFTTGQPEGAGTYAAGQEGQPLPPGPYHWRVRSHDGTNPGDWTVASDDGAAFVVPEPFTLVSAASRRTHGAAGAFDLELVPGTPGAQTVECREQGPTRLVVGFSRPVFALDGVPDETEVGLSAGILHGVTIQGSTMEIELSDVPNCTCLRVTLTGVVDAAGRPLAGLNEFRAKVLLADVTGDGQSNLADAAMTRMYNGYPLEPATARFDLNLDGLINSIDMSMAKAQNGYGVACP